MKEEKKTQQSKVAYHFGSTTTRLMCVYARIWDEISAHVVRISFLFLFYTNLPTFTKQNQFILRFVCCRQQKSCAVINKRERERILNESTHLWFLLLTKNKKKIEEKKVNGDDWFDFVAVVDLHVQDTIWLQNVRWWWWWCV